MGRGRDDRLDRAGGAETTFCAVKVTDWTGDPEEPPAELVGCGLESVLVAAPDDPLEAEDLLELGAELGADELTQ